MFENLSERLERSFKILKGEGKITEINVAETLKEVRRALLDADVNYKVRTRRTGIPYGRRDHRYAAQGPSCYYPDGRLEWCR